MKKMYDRVLLCAEEALSGITFELMSWELKEQTKDDGTIERYTKIEVEVPRGQGEKIFQRCRFSCKLPSLDLRVTEEEIDDGVLVVIEDLKISYLSVQSREVYTKGTGLKIVS